MPYFTKANTIDVAEDLSLGLQLKVGDALAANVDKVVVFGTVVEEKKNNGNEELAARIEALELALTGRLTNLPANTLLGRNTSSGIVETIPQTTFAKPADIDTAIFNLIGGAPGALNTLDELAAALADDANFATSVTNLLALKAPIASPSFTGLMTTAGQIAFPAVQNPSASPNTLDDYEEGTWLPVLTYTSPGTSSITHGWNTGRYQKIGNRVFITFDIRISVFTKGTASGFLVISGLPFPTRAGSGYNNNYGFLVVGNAPFTGIPFLDTGNGLSGGGNIIFIFKCVPNLVNQPLEDPVAGALYWGQIVYETS